MIGEIAGALAALKSAGEIASAMIGVRDATVLQKQLADLYGQIILAQRMAMEANASHAALIDEKSALEQEIMRLKDWEGEKERYHLERLEPGVLVYTMKEAKSAGEPPHHLCAACYEKRIKSFLQVKHHGGGLTEFECHECGKSVTAGTRVRAVGAVGRPTSGGWQGR